MKNTLDICSTDMPSLQHSQAQAAPVAAARDPTNNVLKLVVAASHATASRYIVTNQLQAHRGS